MFETVQEHRPDDAVILIESTSNIGEFHEWEPINRPHGRRLRLCGRTSDHRLPPDAITVDALVRSETVTQCPYKGDGQHWHVVAGDRRVADAAWSLTTPMGDALIIPRWFSFYPAKVDIEVDGVPWR